MNKKWLCKIGIHKWKPSVTFSNAVPWQVRRELGTDVELCSRCFKVKKTPYRG